MDTRSSNSQKACKTICKWDQNEIKDNTSIDAKSSDQQMFQRGDQVAHKRIRSNKANINKAFS